MKQLYLFPTTKEKDVPKVTGSYPHALDNEIAHAKTDEALDDLLQAFEMPDAERTKEGNLITFKGVSQGVNTGGSIEITENALNVTIELPFSAIAFKGRVQKAIDKRIPPFLAE